MAIKKIFSQTALSDLGDLSGYNVVIGKSGEDDIKTVNALDFRGASSDYYPSTGVYRNYQDVIPTSYCKEVKGLNPWVGGTDILLATFASGDLQIGETYRVTGTGAQILHNGTTYDENEEFTASVATFTTVAATPVIKIGTQHSEFGDCSQLYNSWVIEVDDYYYMYYSANTQKYKMPEVSVNVDGTVNDLSASDTIQNNADYGRNDQIFMAYKLKSEGLYSGNWQKWKDSKFPILGISGEYSGENDASNAWFRSIFYDGSQYVIFYTGDSSQDGTTHSPHPMWATSSDAINWTKGGTLTTAGITDLNLGIMFYTNSKYYLLIPNSGLTSVELWSNSSLAETGWTQISTDIIPNYNRIYSFLEIDNTLYFGCRASATLSDITLFSCPVANIETPASWTNEGLIYSAPPGATDTFNNENTSTGASANYHCLLKVDTNKFAVFYSYYKDTYARPPFVADTGIRMITYTSTTPMPN